MHNMIHAYLRDSLANILILTIAAMQTSLSVTGIWKFG